MAYVYQDPSQEEEEQKKIAGTSGVGTTFGTKSSGVSATVPQTPPQGTNAPKSQFTDINAYLEANKPQSSVMGQQIGSQVSQQSDLAKQQAEQANKQYQQDVFGGTPQITDEEVEWAKNNPEEYSDGYQNVYQNRTNDIEYQKEHKPLAPNPSAAPEDTTEQHHFGYREPTEQEQQYVNKGIGVNPYVKPENMHPEQFQAAAAGTYSGPNEIENQGYYTQALSQANKANQQEEAALTNQGRIQVLQGIEKNPTTGITQLNNMLVNQNPETIANLTNTIKGLGSPTDYLNQQAGQASQYATQQKSNLQNISNKIQAEFLGQGGAIPQLRNKVEGEVAAKQTALSNLVDKVSQNLAKGYVYTPEDLTAMGITKEQYNAILPYANALVREYQASSPTGQQYFTQTEVPANYTIENTATPEEVARYNALSTLVNQPNNLVSGSYDPNKLYNPTQIGTFQNQAFQDAIKAQLTDKDRTSIDTLLKPYYNSSIAAEYNKGNIQTAEKLANEMMAGQGIGATIEGYDKNTFVPFATYQKDKKADEMMVRTGLDVVQSIMQGKPVFKENGGYGTVNPTDWNTNQLTWGTQNPYWQLEQHGQPPYNV